MAKETIQVSNTQLKDLKEALDLDIKSLDSHKLVLQENTKIEKFTPKQKIFVEQFKKEMLPDNADQSIIVAVNAAANVLAFKYAKQIKAIRHKIEDEGKKKKKGKNLTKKKDSAHGNLLNLAADAADRAIGYIDANNLNINTYNIVKGVQEGQAVTSQRKYYTDKNSLSAGMGQSTKKLHRAHAWSSGGIFAGGKDKYGQLNTTYEDIALLRKSISTQQAQITRLENTLEAAEKQKSVEVDPAKQTNIEPRNVDAQEVEKEVDKPTTLQEEADKAARQDLRMINAVEKYAKSKERQEQRRHLREDLLGIKPSRWQLVRRFVSHYARMAVQPITDFNQKRSAKKGAKLYAKLHRADLIEKAVKKSETKTFAQEIEDHTKAFENMLARPEQLENLAKLAPQEATKLGITDLNAEIEHEQEVAGVLKRVAVVVGAGNLQIQDGKGASMKTKAANAENIPIASRLLTGQRVLINDPTGKIWRYIAGDSISLARSGQKARDQGAAIYVRGAATHGVAQDVNGNIVEKKLNPAQGAKNIYKKVTGHFGMDVAVGAVGQKDIHGVPITTNGTTGHMYFHRDEKTGAILVGMEGCKPPTGLFETVGGQYGSHTKMGGKDKLSVTGGRPSDALATQLASERTAGTLDPLYANSNVGARYNTLNIPAFSSDQIAKIQQTDINTIANNIASCTPQKSMDALIAAKPIGKTPAPSAVKSPAVSADKARQSTQQIDKKVEKDVMPKSTEAGFPQNPVDFITTPNLVDITLNKGFMAKLIPGVKEVARRFTSFLKRDKHSNQDIIEQKNETQKRDVQQKGR